MKSIPFETEHLYAGHKALGSVRLIEARIPLRVDMVVDSGAEITVLNRGFVSVLGIADVHSGEPIELIVANNDSRPAWIHPVKIEVLGRTLTIEAAFCPEWDMKNLLGMRGFFDQLVIAFDHEWRQLYL
jgi:predicted aspartyl protease